MIYACLAAQVAAYSYPRNTCRNPEDWSHLRPRSSPALAPCSLNNKVCHNAPQHARSIRYANQCNTKRSKRNPKNNSHPEYLDWFRVSGFGPSG